MSFSNVNNNNGVAGNQHSTPPMPGRNAADVALQLNTAARVGLSASHAIRAGVARKEPTSLVRSVSSHFSTQLDSRYLNALPDYGQLLVPYNQKHSKTMSDSSEKAVASDEAFRVCLNGKEESESTFMSMIYGMKEVEGLLNELAETGAGGWEQKISDYVHYLYVELGKGRSFREIFRTLNGTEQKQIQQVMAAIRILQNDQGLTGFDDNDPKSTLLPAPHPSSSQHRASSSKADARCASPNPLKTEGSATGETAKKHLKRKTMSDSSEKTIASDEAFKVCLNGKEESESTFMSRIYGMKEVEGLLNELEQTKADGWEQKIADYVHHLYIELGKGRSFEEISEALDNTEQEQIQQVMNAIRTLQTSQGLTGFGDSHSRASAQGGASSHSKSQTSQSSNNPPNQTEELEPTPAGQLFSRIPDRSLSSKENNSLTEEDLVKKLILLLAGIKPENITLSVQILYALCKAGSSTTLKTICTITTRKQPLSRSLSLILPQVARAIYQLETQEELKGFNITSRPLIQRWLGVSEMTPFRSAILNSAQSWFYIQGGEIPSDILVGCVKKLIKEMDPEAPVPLDKTIRDRINLISSLGRAPENVSVRAALGDTSYYVRKNLKLISGALYYLNTKKGMKGETNITWPKIIQGWFQEMASKIDKLKKFDDQDLDKIK